MSGHTKGIDREPFPNSAGRRPHCPHCGHPFAVADAQIAVIAASRQFSVATRDEAPFQAAGVPVINPWTAMPGTDPGGRRRARAHP